ncbi:hypothetical protein [Paraburkholderia sp. J94]|uniref:hypothetical protein n=1 Tax=Paraburkholderia sp. J94 TaxID=2805441 RepID=UPI002AB32605|nr:hypothetical protein [Paraburkholderia sp. J94]
MQAIVTARMETMNASNSHGRSLADLTVRELAGLRLLNERLALAERGILERAFARTQPEHDVESNNDVNVQAHVICHATASDSATFTLDAHALLDNTHAQCANEALPEPLADMTACRLFNDLRVQHCGGDWTRMLVIDVIRIDLSIVQRRSQTWTA